MKDFKVKVEKTDEPKIWMSGPIVVDPKDPLYGKSYSKLAIIAEPHAMMAPLLPSTSTERKAVPLASGVLDYFPAALAAVAEVSKHGNDQHNPGEPLHWARGKSMDQADCLIRHFLERGTDDSDGLRHSAKMAWRALALLQLELEAAGHPIARNAR